jgi:hypothetical protein
MCIRKAARGTSGIPSHGRWTRTSAPQVQLEKSTVVSSNYNSQQRSPTPYSAYPLPELHSSPSIPYVVPNAPTTPNYHTAHFPNEHDFSPQEEGLRHLPASNVRDSQVAQLQASETLLDERTARVKRLTQTEEEQATMQQEMERLRHSGTE